MTKDDVVYVLTHLSVQAYWKRVWTAQEVRYSRSATLVTFFGRAPIGVLLFFFLEKLASTMITSPDSPRDPSNQRFFLQSYLHLFRRTCLSVQPYYLRDVKHLDLDGRIDLCSLIEASDQRDLVFGFWGWLPPQIREKVRVDYSRPAEEVLDACKRAFLATAARLEFLSLSNFYSRQNPSGLPSWDPELFYFRRGRCQGGGPVGRDYSKSSFPRPKPRADGEGPSGDLGRVEGSSHRRSLGGKRHFSREETQLVSAG